MPELEDPIETELEVGGATIMRIYKFVEIKYAEKVKQWIRDNKSLKGAIRSLYNIA